MNIYIYTSLQPDITSTCLIASHADILLARHAGEECVTSQKNVCVGGYLLNLLAGSVVQVFWQQS